MLKPLVIALLAVATFAQTALTPNNSHPRAADGPEALAQKFGWKIIREKKFSLLPGQVMEVWKFPATGTLRRLRVDVDSESAISSGFTYTGPFLEAVAQPSFRPSMLDFSNMPCAHLRALEASTGCTLDARYPPSYIVRDDRMGGTQALGVVGVWMRNKNAVERATAPNTVKVIVRVWTCISNCPAS